MPVSVETRRRFLEYRDLGPERLGLLRVLHELRIAPANDTVKRSSQTNENAARSCHLRVPVAGNSSTESLALWAAFFQCAAPKGAPVLLISRKTTNWLDVVVGEPATDDFFCLGVSLKALPLTTEIPYELSPELKPSLGKVTSRFLGEEPTTAVVEQRAPATIPVASEKKVAAIPPSQKKRNLILPLVFCVVVLIGAGGLWLVSANRSAKPVSFESNSSAPVPSGATPVKVKETATTDESYSATMKDARAALDRKDYAVAIAKADAALGFKKDDPAATRMKLDAQARQRAKEAQAQGEENYRRALGAAQSAYDRNDYAVAMSQADVALGIKTNDPAAAKLKADAQARLDLVALEIQRQEKYDAAMSEARAAFGKKDYSNSIAKADVALNLRTNDTTATKLRNDAQAAQREILAQAERDARYRELMNSAQAAYDGKDYPNAIARAEAALAIRPGDPAATGLQKKASDDKDLQNAQTCVDRGEFEKAKNLCSAHAGTPAFDELARKVKDKQAAGFDTELEVYLVRFGLLDPKKAKTNEARQETRWLGELPIQQRDQCLTDVEVLRKAFQSSDRLDAVHEKQLNELKRAINNHL